MISSKIAKAKKKYIDSYDPNETSNLERVLRTVRYILRTPEYADIVEHSKKIMAQLNKQKTNFLAKKTKKLIQTKLTPRKKK